ncbi:uncharacterized protein [Ptychodera flava]|uniref:uncharacterized protein n=1 Tax=Ptychodera flava TaxID=63121 RepID=UPI003969D71E
MTSGGTVVLKTPSLVLNLEKNTIQDLTNCTIMVGPHTGVQIPSVEHIFPHLRRSLIMNRMISRLAADVHRITNLTQQQFSTDILTLSFKNETGQELKVKNTTQDIQIWLGNRPKPLNETLVIGREHSNNNAATHYVFEIENSKPYHAIQIMLEASVPVFENFTANVSAVLPENSEDHSSFQVSKKAIFNGNINNIFIPEEIGTGTGRYNISFDLVYSNGVEFKVSTTNHRCSYSVDKTKTWQSSGCIPTIQRPFHDMFVQSSYNVCCSVAWRALKPTPTQQQKKWHKAYFHMLMMHIMSESV